MAERGLPGSNFDETFEFERRISELEADIISRAPANSEIDPSTVLQVGSGVPRVDGMVLTPTPAKAVLNWNSVPITDLKRYEVQIDTTTSFTSTNLTTRFTRETGFTWAEGVGGTTYFFRVRARNIAEDVGPYSAILNGTTGQVVTADIGDGAVTTTKVADNAITNITSGFGDSAVTLTSTVSFATVISTAISTSTTSTVFIIATCVASGSAASVWSPRLDKGGAVTLYTQLDVEVGGGSTDRRNITFIFEDTTPNDGETSYSILGKKVSGADTTITQRSIMAIEVKK